MNCNRISLSISIIQNYVSIPNRDLDELQFRPRSFVAILATVSIPNRDLDELQWQEPETQTVFSFQGAVARFFSNHSIREFVWKECEESQVTYF